MAGSVQALRGIIEELKGGDQSSNAKFCQKFSQVWHTLYQELKIASHSKWRGYVNTDILKALITDMEHYPPNEEHKLGYYLGEYAGEKWLPIPFREIP